jgi:thymidine phosphorylase
VKTTGLLTDMDQPLASTAGNALEVLECVRVLRGEEGEGRLAELSIRLSAELASLGGLGGEKEIRTALASGAAAERFGRMVAALGGPADFVERAEDHLPRAPVVRPVLAERSGVLAAMETRELGLAVVELGGGRRRASDTIDHAVGLSGFLPLGSRISEGQPLCVIHARSEDDWSAAATRVAAAMTLGEAVGDLGPLVLDTLHG